MSLHFFLLFKDYEYYSSAIVLIQLPLNRRGLFEHLMLYYTMHYFCRLLNYEGSLMAFAGKSDKKENVTAAIAANIWMSHERGGHTALPDETLNFIVLDCLVSLKKYG